MPTSTHHPISLHSSPASQTMHATQAPQVTQTSENRMSSPLTKSTPSKERVDWNDEMINALISFYEEHKESFQSSTVSTFFADLSDKLGIPSNRISEKFIRLKHQYRVTAENLNKKGGMNPESIVFKRMDKIFASSKSSPAASAPNSGTAPTKEVFTDDASVVSKPIMTSNSCTVGPTVASNGGFTSKLVFPSKEPKPSAALAASKSTTVGSSSNGSLLTSAPIHMPKPFNELGPFSHTFASKEILCPPIQSTPQGAPTDASMLYSGPMPLMAPTTAINAYTSTTSQSIPAAPTLPLPPPPSHATDALNIATMPVMPSSSEEVALRREEAIIQKLKLDHELELRKQENEYTIQMRQLDLAERELAYREAKLAHRREKLHRRWASPTLESAPSRNESSQN